MRTPTRNNPPLTDEENPYWISFSDLMSGLLVIFILAAVALIIELTEAQENIKEDISELKNAEKARHDIIHEVSEVLNEKWNIRVVVDETVLRLSEDALAFDTNSYRIPDEEPVQEALRRIGSVLHEALNRPISEEASAKLRFEYLDTVFIEGHTDSRGTKFLKGNWGLSAVRAISVWEYWLENLDHTPSFENMTNAFGDKLFSVSGYAASRRINEVEETPEDQRENRRIDIRITIKRPSSAELEAIVE